MGSLDDVGRQRLDPREQDEEDERRPVPDVDDDDRPERVVDRAEPAHRAEPRGHERLIEDAELEIVHELPHAADGDRRHEDRQDHERPDDALGPRQPADQERDREAQHHLRRDRGDHEDQGVAERGPEHPVREQELEIARRRQSPDLRPLGERDGRDAHPQKVERGVHGERDEDEERREQRPVLEAAIEQLGETGAAAPVRHGDSLAPGCHGPPAQPAPPRRTVPQDGRARRLATYSGSGSSMPVLRPFCSKIVMISRAASLSAAAEPSSPISAWLSRRPSTYNGRGEGAKEPRRQRSRHVSLPGWGGSRCAGRVRTG